jgi:hypothetical protein
MNTEQIITAVREQSRQLDSLRDSLKAEYRYYGATLKEINPQSSEYQIVLGAFLAIEKILNETENGFFQASSALDLDKEIETIVKKHFPSIYKRYRKRTTGTRHSLA